MLQSKTPPLACSTCAIGKTTQTKWTVNHGIVDVKVSSHTMLEYMDQEESKFKLLPELKRAQSYRR